jgi:hypothetical protein
MRKRELRTGVDAGIDRYSDRQEATPGGMGGRLWAGSVDEFLHGA